LKGNPPEPEVQKIPQKQTNNIRIPPPDSIRNGVFLLDVGGSTLVVARPKGREKGGKQEGGGATTPAIAAAHRLMRLVPSNASECQEPKADPVKHFCLPRSRRRGKTKKTIKKNLNNKPKTTDFRGRCSSDEQSGGQRKWEEHRTALLGGRNAGRSKGGGGENDRHRGGAEKCSKHGLEIV